jgi:hypothetical protein
MLEKSAVTRTAHAISLTLAEGKAMAIRFIFAGCWARAASGHVVCRATKKRDELAPYAMEAALYQDQTSLTTGSTAQ